MRLEKTLWEWVIWTVGILLIPTAALAAVIQVGPESRYTRPSEAAKVARDGDIIEITAGTYMYDAAVWRQNNLTIRGIGGRAHLKADGTAAEGKAIWVVQGRNTTIENVEFSGVRVRHKNGAGIRQEGSGLIVRKCYFHDNEMGILAGRNETSDILIEHSEFAHNAVGGDYSQHGSIGHNIYIGEVRSFTLRYSYIHHARIGHNVKSRARENYILYNRLMDEKTGSSSYIVDLSIGGTSYLIGNLFQQGPKNDNATLVSYASEGEGNPSQGFYVVNNTFVNEHQSGIYIKNWSKTTSARIMNNIFASIGDTILDGRGEMVNNLVTDEPGFVSISEFDYRLTASSPAVDAGADPGSANGFSLTPLWHYSHVAGKEKRGVAGTIDVGAYEFGNH